MIEGSSNRHDSVDARTFFTPWDSPPENCNDGQIPLLDGNPNHHQDHHITQNHLIKLILFFFLLLVVGEVQYSQLQSNMQNVHFVSNLLIARSVRAYPQAAPTQQAEPGLSPQRLPSDKSTVLPRSR